MERAPSAREKAWSASSMKDFELCANGWGLCGMLIWELGGQKMGRKGSGGVRGREGPGGVCGGAFLFLCSHQQ